jgi:hypothetical protein
MKMKIIKPMSTFFKVGDVVNMRITGKRGDFVISAGDRKQSFGFLYRSCLMPLGEEEENSGETQPANPASKV